MQDKEQDRGVRNTSTHEVQRWCKKKVQQTCNTSKLGVGAGCKVQVKHARQKYETKSEVERCKATMWQRCKQVKVSVINGRKSIIRCKTSMQDKRMDMRLKAATWRCDKHARQVRVSVKLKLGVPLKRNYCICKIIILIIRLLAVHCLIILILYWLLQMKKGVYQNKKVNKIRIRCWSIRINVSRIRFKPSHIRVVTCHTTWQHSIWHTKCNNSYY